MKRGQVLVLVVLGLVAVLAFVGLALDSSRIYQTRRLLQNAADAASLAGALELAKNRSITQAELWNKIAQFLQHNGAVPPSSRAWLLQGNTRLVEISQSTSSEPAPRSANRVEVETCRAIPVLFAGFLGQSQSSIRARSCAAIGNLRVLEPRNNVVPVAIHYEVVRDAKAGDILIVWDGYQVTVRTPNNVDRNYGDTDNPYSGWLNLAWIHNELEGSIGNREVDQSHSQANVDDWIMNGNPFPIFVGSLSIPPTPPAIDGDFIMGDPGIRASGLKKLKEKCNQIVARGERSIFHFIVFDRFFDRYGMNQLFPYHSPKFPNSLYFHAVGFVAVEVTEVNWQGSAGGGKYIKGELVKFVQIGETMESESAGGGVDGEMVKAVTLVE